jgi:hypothetical protein
MTWRAGRLQGSAITALAKSPIARMTLRAGPLQTTKSSVENLRVQHIAVEEIADGVWNIAYYRTLFGRIDERSGKITGV